MEERCDQIVDCRDKSDENEGNCKGLMGGVLLAIISSILVTGLVLSWPGKYSNFLFSAMFE